MCNITVDVDFELGPARHRRTVRRTNRQTDRQTT